jgi:hypothetical protein
MKYLSLLSFLLIGSFAFAQLGVEVGYQSINGKVKYAGNTSKESTSAVTIGLAYDLELSETLDLQPSIGFAIGEKIDNESNNAIGFGAGLHYYFNNRDAGFYAGPVLSYSHTLEDIDTTQLSKGVVGSGLVVGYDISPQFSVLAGYGFSLTNPSKIDGVKVSSNSIGFTLQYFFR